MNAFSQNTEALKNIQPILAETLETATSLAQYLQETPDGSQTLRKKGFEGAWLQSRRAPLQEARRMVEKIQLKPLQPCIVIGVGLGYVIKNLIKNSPSTQIIVLENDLNLLRTVLELHNFSNSIRQGRLSFALDLPGQPISAVLDFFAEALNYHGYQSIFHAYTQNDRNYKDLFSELGNWVRLRAVDIRTQMFQSRVSLENLINNLPHYLQFPGITEFKDCLRDVPAVMVGSGPSLNRNINVLKEYSGHVFVLAVSSALQRIMKEGIPVHATNIVDYSRLSSRYFVDLPGEAPPLWAHPRASSEVLDLYQGPKILLDDELYRKLLEATVPDHGTFIAQGNNVSHYAFLILQHLGCNPIIFCGMDQAYSFHTTHTPGSPFHDDWVAANNRFFNHELSELIMLTSLVNETLTTTDMYGNTILTDNLFDSSATVLEQLVGFFPETTVLNATEGGRRLKGVKDLSLRNVLEQYAKQPLALDSYWEKVHLPKKATQAFLHNGLQKLQKIKTFGTTLQEVFSQAKRIIQKAEKKLLKGEEPTELADALDRLNDKLNKQPGVYDAVYTYAAADGIIRQKSEALLADQSIPMIERLRTLAKREKAFIIALEEALKRWEDLLIKGIERMKEEQEF